MNSSPTQKGKNAPCPSTCGSTFGLTFVPDAVWLRACIISQREPDLLCATQCKAKTLLCVKAVHSIQAFGKWFDTPTTFEPATHCALDTRNIAAANALASRLQFLNSSLTGWGIIQQHIAQQKQPALLQ